MEAVTEKPQEYRFWADDGQPEENKLIAACIADQQRAGFKELLDIRLVDCPNCGSKGMNTGWGFWRFVCGAEILSDGEPSEPCSNPQS